MVSLIVVFASTLLDVSLSREETRKWLIPAVVLFLETSLNLSRRRALRNVVLPTDTCPIIAILISNDGFFMISSSFDVARFKLNKMIYKFDDSLKWFLCDLLLLERFG